MARTSTPLTQYSLRWKRKKEIEKKGGKKNQPERPLANPNFPLPKERRRKRGGGKKKREPASPKPHVGDSHTNALSSSCATVSAGVRKGKGLRRGKKKGGEEKNWNKRIMISTISPLSPSFWREAIEMGEKEKEGSPWGKKKGKERKGSAVTTPSSPHFSCYFSYNSS